MGRVEYGTSIHIDEVIGIHKVSGLAGLAQSLEDSNGDGIAGNAGDREYFVRVSAYAAWIDEAMGKAALEEAARAVGAPANPRR